MVAPRRSALRRIGKTPILGPSVAAALAVALHSCLIDPQKDYPVASSTNGGDGSKSSAGTNGMQAGGGASAAAMGGAADAVDGGAAGRADNAGEAAGPPASCADAHAQGIVKDGQVQIDPDHSGPIKPFRVYCHHMSSAQPEEFLELPHVDASGFPNMNTSTFGNIGADTCPCPGPVTSSFSKVRFRTSDLTVLIADRAFATFLGDATCLDNAHLQGACDHEYLGYATAADCLGTSITGAAEIDLRDTPFHIAPQAMFAAFGYTPSGNVTVSDDRKRASLVGGGFCGGFSPADPAYAGGGWLIGGELALEQD